MPSSPAMKGPEIAAFLRSNVEPLHRRMGADQYRAAAFLTDGTYLPCVIFESKNAHVELALRRFGELEKRPDQYRTVVASFTTYWSMLNSRVVSRLELSPFAWPLDILREIHGETVMGWTAFVATMKDGKRFSYEVASMAEPFYELPDGYSAGDVMGIQSGVTYSDAYGVEDYRRNPHHAAIQFYREKPCFYCYLMELD